MTENDRIRDIRKVKKLTLERFGAAVGVQKSAISKIERGENAVSEQIRLSICREFNVSETWLRTGEGEMFIPEPSNALETFIRERNLSPSDRVLIQKFAALDAQSRQAVVDYVITVSDEILKAIPASQQSEPDLAAKVAALERQNAEKDKQLQELSARLSAMEEEDELGWQSDTENLA